MEMDFLGLNLKEPVATVKEETVDGSKDQVFMGSSEMQRAFPNKIWAVPHFTSFKKSGQEEKPKKTLFDSLTSSAFQPIAPTNLFNSNHRLSGVSQRNFNDDKQGAHRAIQAYPFNSVDAPHRSHEVRTFPLYNHSFSVPATNPLFKMHSGIGGLVLTSNSSVQQPLGGIPVMNPFVPFTGSMAGTYASRNASKPVAALAQLSIFYGGTVNVYEDISPEKAQAIMCLAGNGSLPTANDGSPNVDVLSLDTKHVSEGVLGNQFHATAVCSGPPSSISVTSNLSAQSSGTACNTDDLIAIKTIGDLAPRNQPEPLKVVTSVGSTGGALMPAAVPQARKASLARFLEKRKERMTNAGPYSCKKSIEGAYGSDAGGFAGKAQTASIALSSSMEQSW